MKVLLVTSWATACGIAEHSAMLVEAVTAADPAITIAPSAPALDPRLLPLDEREPFDLLHLNYQAGLHSRWTPALLADARRLLKKPIVVTYHDTGVPNADLCKAIIEQADVAVVHEPFDDLPGHKTFYWRQGVPDWPLVQYLKRRDAAHAWQPLLGTVGFAFPWKCYDELARVTGEIGWALMLLAPQATPEQQATWKRLNPDLICRADFVPRNRVTAMLGACDATAFCYVCHNTGTSGAIRQGLAARKPLYALETCRQFRDLYLDPLANKYLRWVKDFDELKTRLMHCPMQRVDPGVVAIAHRDSWANLGVRYAALYRSLVR